LHYRYEAVNDRVILLLRAWPC